MPYHDHRTLDIGDKTDTRAKLVIFQVMSPKRGSVRCTLGVWAQTVKRAKEMAREYRDANYPGCPVP